MKKILLTTFTVSVLFFSGSLFASAQYYYQNPNYTYTTYSNSYTYQNSLNNCYYTNTYPPTYYGNCQGMNYGYLNNGYNYQVQYQQPTYTYPNTNYYNNVGPYYTYGYANGSWRPGYSTNNLSNLVNNVFQTVNQALTPNTYCYYQNGYQVCY